MDNHFFSLTDLFFAICLHWEFLMQKKGKQGETEIQIGIQQKHELFQTFLVEVVNTYVRLGCQ